MIYLHLGIRIPAPFAFLRMLSSVRPPHLSMQKLNSQDFQHFQKTKKNCKKYSYAGQNRGDYLGMTTVSCGIDYNKEQQRIITNMVRYTTIMFINQPPSLTQTADRM